ncbi:hypothetical protein XA68_15706 [Ophiocordyceps unilateralis]|uniref:Eisosome protein 1 n=1 Tax=Ophiocordyceps unilateralis TaxID=268505 RepID=A0A2A9PL49_OPHUN|nr:hypothetical protein XA68_15706 [Ophiocordyceps unilateralis]
MAVAATASTPAPDKLQQLSTATAAGRTAYKQPPSYSATDGAAIVAANQGWARSKSTEPPKPDRASTASAAAVLAKDHQMPSQWHPSAHPHGYLAASMAYDSAGAALTKQPAGLSPAAQKRQTWSHSAATQALEAGRSGSLGASRARPSTRPMTMRMSAPPTMSKRYLHHGIDHSSAALGAANAHRNSLLPKQPASYMPKPSDEHGCVIPYTTMDRSMFTSAPPVQPVLDARARQEKLQQSALEMAKLMFDRQKQMTDEARAAQDEPVQPNPYINLQYAAQRQAQERLSQLHDDSLQNLEYRDYYYGHLLPPAKKKKKSRSKSKSKRRSSSTGRVRDAVPPVPGQGPIFTTRMSQVDMEQRERDREALLAAAQRNVKERLRGMEGKKSRKDKGKLPSANMTQWELQAQQALQAQHQEESERRDLVDLGGGKFMTPDEINAIASRRVQPVLDDIDAKATAERERKAQAKEKRGKSKKRKSRKLDATTDAADVANERLQEGDEATAENAEDEGEHADDELHNGQDEAAEEHRVAQVGSPVEQRMAEREGLVGQQVEGVEDHHEQLDATRHHVRHDAEETVESREQLHEEPLREEPLHDDAQYVHHDHVEEAVGQPDEQLHEGQHYVGHDQAEESGEPAEQMREDAYETADQSQHEQQQVYHPRQEPAEAYRHHGEESEEDEEDYVDVVHEKTREASESGQHHVQEHVAGPEDREPVPEAEDAAQDYDGHGASALDPHADALPPRYTPEVTPSRSTPAPPPPPKSGVRGWIRNRFSRRKSVSDHQQRERRRSFFGGAKAQKMNQSDTSLGHQGLTENSEPAHFEDGAEESGVAAHLGHTAADETGHGGSEAVDETTARDPAAAETTHGHGDELEAHDGHQGQAVSNTAESIASTAAEVRDSDSTFVTPTSRLGSGNLRDSRFREMMDM